MVKYIRTTTTKNLGEKVWHDFEGKIQKSAGQGKIENVLTTLLAPSEKLELTRRLVVVSLLQD